MNDPEGKGSSKFSCKHKHFCFEHDTAFFRGEDLDGCWACVKSRGAHDHSKRDGHGDGETGEEVDNGKDGKAAVA